jgi:hypothetical protein
LLSDQNPVTVPFLLIIYQINTAVARKKRTVNSLLEHNGSSIQILIKLLEPKKRQSQNKKILETFNIFKDLGTGGRTRTDTSQGRLDFESSASTNSTTPALQKQYQTGLPIPPPLSG